MIFESFFTSIHTFLSGLSLFELVLSFLLLLALFVASLLGLCMAILFYRWTLRDEDEEEGR